MVQGPSAPLAQSGFSFDNCQRNAHLEQKGFGVPKARKTGTTICGIIYKDGVILGADTRATEGNIVADKNCSKIHRIADSIFCCGAGTAADTEMTTKMIESKMELLRLHMNRDVRVATACTRLKRFLFRYQGYIGAHLVLGGVDTVGPHIYTVSNNGYTDKVPYTTMGSGSLAAMTVFEARWKPNLTEEEGKKLVRDAIAAGIFNDLGSGSNVDLCVIKKGETKFLRTYEEANKKGVRNGDYQYKVGTTTLLKPAVIRHVPLEVVTEYKSGSQDEPMS